jgi:hypothetical protein
MRFISIVPLFFLFSCQVALEGDIRETPDGIHVRNNNPGPWLHVRMELDGEYLLHLDSLGAGDDTLLALKDFRNGMGQTYAERGTRPQSLTIYAAQGVMQKHW